MGKIAYVFAGRNGLDTSVFRANILRIPEVSLRVREAQKILDGLDLPRVDLHSYIASEDDAFMRNIRLKGLAAAIVQVGLHDRIAKQGQTRVAEILVGPVNADSALLTVAGRQSFEEMVRKSPALETLKPSERLTVLTVAQPAPLLAGLSLTEFEAIARQPESNQLVTIRSGEMDMTKLLASLVEESGVRAFINIGPSGLIERDRLDGAEIELLDSIDLDPMLLSWFWSSIRLDTKAIAN